MSSLFHLAAFRGEGNLDYRKLRGNPYFKMKERLGRKTLFR